MRTTLLFVCLVSAALLCPAQSADSQPALGKKHYESRCAGCHGGDGNGGELAPSITDKMVGRPDSDLAALIRNGLPAQGMPAFKVADAEMKELLTYLRTLRPRGRGPQQIQAKTTDGRTINGVVRNNTGRDTQVLSSEGKVHLLRKQGDLYREVTSQVDWPGYHGDPKGNRYSTMTQINTTNVSSLAPVWMFSLQNTSRLQVTPVVVGGIMYVTSANECYALDAGTGRQIWHYRRPRTQALVGNAAGGINRGVAVSGDRVFMVTDHAHLIALDRFKGTLLWDTEMADWKQNYNATSAPLVVGNLVVAGTSGGDEGVRGFLAAYDAVSGKEVWRFWTVPARGEPGSETWIGKDIDHGCAVTWLTGTYDAELDTLYWPTGNPCPDYNGDERKGDNLYSDSIIAFEPKTGKMKWYFQYTPHDVWDWDAQQPPVLVDAEWEGKPRKLLLHANRNGFFYVLDRTNGKFLRGKPFVKKLTWASGLTPEGRPIKLPNQEPNDEGARVCPAVEGATNWFSTSYNPATGYYYVQTLEKCNVFTKSAIEWQAGRAYFGGSARPVPGDNPLKLLRAIDVKTGNIAWEVPQPGSANSWGGAMSTAGGLVFFGEESGAFSAVDAKSGKPLWQFQTGELWKASPMTYMFDNKQYIAVANGSNIIAFALVGNPKP